MKTSDQHHTDKEPPQTEPTQTETTLAQPQTYPEQQPIAATTTPPSTEQPPNANKAKTSPGAFLTGLMTLVTTIGRFLRGIWTVATRIDSAIWHFIVLIWRGVSRGVVMITDWVIEGFIAFVLWIPTPAGRGYCAFFSVFMIIASFWVADELRSAGLTLRAANASAPANAPTETDDPIMARIGGQYVHLSEVEAAARSSGTLQQSEKLAFDTEFTRELVATFVDQRLLAQAAENNNLGRDDMLTSRLRAARDRILAAAYLDQILKDEVTDEKVKALFQSQSDLASLGEEIRMRHILVATRSDASDIISAVESGVDFATIARARSLDRGTAPHGGDTGYITRDMVSDEFGRIAFAINTGTISPPFRTSEGWNVVQILEKRAAAGIAFEAVEENLRRFMTLRTIDKTLANLKQDYDVVIYNYNDPSGKNVAQP